MNKFKKVSDKSLPGLLIGVVAVTLGIVVIGFVFYLGTQSPLFRTPPEDQLLVSPIIGTATSTVEIIVTDLPSPTLETLEDSPTPTLQPGSETPSDSSYPTETPEFSQTPTPTQVSGGESNPADWAKIIESNPANWIYLGPNNTFKKTWTIKNVGTTTWTTDYDLVFISGSWMTNKKVFALSRQVKPGQTVDLTLSLLAPKTPGSYEGFWMLRNNLGDVFGTGPDGENAFAVKIVVLNLDPASRYDFILERCSAVWWNGGGMSVPCVSEAVQIRGFVLLDPMPVLENGPSDRPILWVHPENQIEGILSGKYPAVRIKAGDHFKARVGCIGGYTKCNVTFKLLYQIGSNPQQSLGTWQELYGGGITRIDIDLSHLVDEEVKFILRVINSNNTPSAAQGFWMIPRIVSVEPASTIIPVPTMTATETPTETPVFEDTPEPTETSTGG